ncbi:MAG: DUF1501 domain-containing protein [Planctomycetota bacterium]
MSDARPTQLTHKRSVPSSRRELLRNAGVGFGSLALHDLMARCSFGGSPSNQKESRQHHPATAKRVIFLFMEGGPSHLDLFDPKPLLNRLAGQPIPKSFGKVVTAMGEFHSPLLESKRQWRRHGESGLWVSDWLPNVAEHADDLAVIRSCVADGINHSAGVCQMNTCSILSGRPSLGAWASYGLGSENDNLPAFVVMQDNKSSVVNGPRNWGAGFMPAVFQGTRLSEGKQPIAHLQSPEGFSDLRQRQKLQFLDKLNRRYADEHPEQTELEARIASYELAFRMQSEAPDAIDLNQESQNTLQAYGIGQKPTDAYGRLCLLGRRLAERGVRFIQLYSGAGSKWDSHDQIEKKHSGLCRSVDQPIAALLTDLKQRGMLDETLVVWGGEFGRTPMSEKGDGRDHNPSGFTMWMAGGGVKGGQVIGETDELGLHAISDRQHVHDLHASILHLMGLDNMELTYRYKGRPERPTVNEGRFCSKLVS